MVYVCIHVFHDMTQNRHRMPDGYFTLRNARNDHGIVTSVDTYRYVEGICDVVADGVRYEDPCFVDEVGIIATSRQHGGCACGRRTVEK